MKQSCGRIEKTETPALPPGRSGAGKKEATKMKKGICALLLLAMLFSMGMTHAALGEAAKDIYSEKMDYTVRDSGHPTAFDSRGAVIIYVKKAGYVPNLVINRRDGQLNNPVNYLNNVWREYMEDTYGDSVGTNPCRQVEIGGKTLYMARYHYTANGNGLILMVSIERRTDGDVEYQVKYQEGKYEDVEALLDATVRSYHPGKPAAAEKKEKTSGRVMEPLPADADPDNGVFRAALEDRDKIYENGFFTAALYLEDRYDASDVEGIRAGDQILVAGKTLTVKQVVPHGEEGFEIYPEEDFFSYCAFRPTGDGAYTALVDDWTPCTFVARKRVMMPLPYATAIYEVSGGEEPEKQDTDAFIGKLVKTDSTEYYNQYNTTATFEKGTLTKLVCADYPAGPTE